MFYGKYKRFQICGMTLMEVVISMAILSLLGVGTIRTLFLNQYVSGRAFYENSALAVAQGYLDQIRVMPYNILESAADTAAANRSALTSLGAVASKTYQTNALLGSVRLPTNSLENVALPANANPDTDAPLYVGATVSRSVLLQVSSTNLSTPTLAMPMELQASINNLYTGSTGLRALEIIINYKYQIKTRGIWTWQSASVRTVRANFQIM